MNQPIPRSFFKYGQRAKYKEYYGEIRIEKPNVKGGEVCFVRPGEAQVLLTQEDTAYYSNDLELLDRTIDQVMEGDRISNHITKREVVARVGNAVGLSRTDGTIEWVQVSKLRNDKYEIVQPNTEEVLTDETAKALRTQSIDNAWQPKRGEKYYTADQDGDIDEYVWVGHFDDVAYCTMGNCHKTEEDAALWHKKYAPAFLHVFKE